jgi:hypothetical protein
MEATGAADELSAKRHEDKSRRPPRKSGGHGPNLAEEVEWLLLPTPKASDGIKGSPNQRHGNGDMTLPSAAASLLPTPRPALPCRQRVK